MQSFRVFTHKDLRTRAHFRPEKYFFAVLEGLAGQAKPEAEKRGKKGIFGVARILPGFCPGSAQELFSITARNGTSQDETSRFSVLQSAVMYGSHAKARHFNSVTITD